MIKRIVICCFILLWAVNIAQAKSHQNKGENKVTKAATFPSSWKYHHLGIPTQEHNENELYDQQYKYYTWGYDESEFSIQMHRFEKNAPLPELIKKYPHVAFQVPDIQEAIKGRTVIWGPIESKPGLHVAMIKDPATGMPVELIQSKLSKEEMMKLHEKLIKK